MNASVFCTPEFDDLCKALAVGSTSSTAQAVRRPTLIHHQEVTTTSAIGKPTATLADLLSACNYTEVARRIGRYPAFVWRLAQGGRLRDHSVIPALADVLRVRPADLERIVTMDTIRAIAMRRSRRALKRDPRGLAA